MRLSVTNLYFVLFQVIVAGHCGVGGGHQMESASRHHRVYATASRYV